MRWKWYDHWAVGLIGSTDEVVFVWRCFSHESGASPRSVGVISQQEVMRLQVNCSSLTQSFLWQRGRLSHTISLWRSFSHKHCSVVSKVFVLRRAAVSESWMISTVVLCIQQCLCAFYLQACWLVLIVCYVISEFLSFQLKWVIITSGKLRFSKSSDMSDLVINNTTW